MKTSLVSELSDLLPTWFAAVLAPAPAILVAKSGAAAVMYFFVACAALVAYSFRREVLGGESNRTPNEWTWHRRILTTATALVAAWLVFASLCVMLLPPHRFVAAMLGFMLLVPCLCIVPYLLLLTRQPFAAVVLSITLVVCMKLAGCVIVVAVYGWNASDFGHTGMPWMRPNLLVWSFWIGTSILSASSYFLGVRRWHNNPARYVMQSEIA